MKVSTTEQMALAEEVITRERDFKLKTVANAVTPVPELVVKLDKEKRDSELVVKKKEERVPSK